MRKIAVSRIYISKEEFYNNHVVELLNSAVVNHYPLTQEQAMTEWLGGAIVLERTKEGETKAVHYTNFDFSSHCPTQYSVKTTLSD